MKMLINGSISNHNSSLRNITWVDDTWCDNNCRLNENCFFDGNDCACDESDDPNDNCQQLMTLFGVIGDTKGDNDNAYHYQLMVFVHCGII